MKKKYFIFLLILFSGLNCATSHAGMATSNIPIGEKKYQVISHVTKKVSWYTFDIGIFGFPLKKPPVHKLIQQAIDENKADALVNIRYWNDKAIFLFMTRNRFGFEADAVKFETPEK